MTMNMNININPFYVYLYTVILQISEEELINALRIINWWTDENGFNPPAICQYGFLAAMQGLKVKVVPRKDNEMLCLEDGSSLPVPDIGHLVVLDRYYYGSEEEAFNLAARLGIDLAKAQRRFTRSIRKICH